MFLASSQATAPVSYSGRTLRIPKECFPIGVAYLATAGAFGVTARQLGLSFWETTLMSVFVFAGSAQMIALGLMAAGASVFMVTLTTFLVNLRHLLMGAALCSSLRGWSNLRRVLFGCQMTDETFAVVYARAGKEGQVTPSFAFPVNWTSHTLWIAGTVIGYLMGGTWNLSKIGLDYAMTGMLLALWVIQVSSRKHLAISLLAGGISLGAVLAGLPPSVSMLLAALLCPTLALAWRNR